LKENNIYGIAYNCPVLERLDNCPLKQVEHLSFKEKVEWIKCLTKKEKQIILAHHKKCSKNR